LHAHSVQATGQTSAARRKRKPAGRKTRAV
jgi:hypothetical protein